MAMAACSQVNHAACDPDVCTPAKLKFWRRNGGLATSFAGGQAFFHESTIPERQRAIVAEAAANGWEARPVNPLYDRMGSFESEGTRKKARDKAIADAARIRV